MINKYDVAIIGCGIIGASLAYELSRYKTRVVVLEKENDICCGTTKANSAIIHAGYDPQPGTLMAELNVKGCQMAKELCADLGVPYRQTGSLVLAFDDTDMQTLNTLYRRGVENSVPGLRLLSRDELRAIEPEVSESAIGALYAPTAAIVSPWEYGIALAETAVKNGVDLLLSTEVLSITDESDHWSLQTKDQVIKADFVINAAGVNSDIIHNMVAEPAFKITPSKGEYYLLDKSEGDRVRHVVFQCPTVNGKGVLVSPTVHGNLIVGPNAVATNREDLATTGEGLDFIRNSAVRSVPSISFGENIRNFAGLRANSDVDDFIIGICARHFVDLAGIKSPGLTAAPAIAVHAVGLLKDDGLKLENKEHWNGTRKRIRFSELTPEERAQLISNNPAYGRVVCRCETITEGEIIDTLRSPIPAHTVDGVKRRAGSGMGRCQGGFCAPRIVEIISREYQIPPEQVLQDGEGSFILAEHTKRREI
ncbi:MAG: NAD(P)/FAD-dependent oxidoreductase [Clostridiales bacterium]|jgi:glycerol-3-phosphate dehydrogenase|nr:NAD(P)/FAD-dependent oxidoreductase [Clostridiales bacterium]